MLPAKSHNPGLVEVKGPAFREREPELNFIGLLLYQKEEHNSGSRRKMPQFAKRL